MSLAGTQNKMAITPTDYYTSIQKKEREPSAERTRPEPEAGSLEEWLRNHPADSDTLQGHMHEDPTTHYEQWKQKALSEENPLPWQKYMPKQVDYIAGDIYQRAMHGAIKNDYSLENSYLGGIGGKYSNPSLLGGDGGPMSQAISRKYARDYSSKVKSIEDQFAAKKPGILSQQMGRATDIYNKQMQLRMQNFKEQYDYQVQRAKALADFNNMKAMLNAQTASGIFGFISKLAGTIAGKSGDK